MNHHEAITHLRRLLSETHRQVVVGERTQVTVSTDTLAALLDLAALTTEYQAAVAYARVPAQLARNVEVAHCEGKLDESFKRLAASVR